VERQQPGQFLASKLIGTTVYGTNNERVGDVNDVVMDRDGRAQALVIGVGGFLGIGEKDVAVPFNAVEFGSGNTGTASGASGSAGGAGTTGGTTSTTGSTGGAANATARNDGAPDRIVLRMTKDQLNAAPQFTRLSSASSSSASGSGSNAGSGARTTPNPPGSATSSGTNPSTGTGGSAGSTR